MEAVPDTDVDSTEVRSVLEGKVSFPIDPSSGCRFRTQCPIATAECADPFEPRQFSDTQTVSCVKRLPEEDAGRLTSVSGDGAVAGDD